MRARVLVDNISKDSLAAEWGLSLYIEFREHKILLDAGTTAAFLENASDLDIDLAKVDFGVLSHAHYDHADGLEAFFVANSHAKVYIRSGAKANCFGKKDGKLRYIGINKAMKRRYNQRFVRVEGDYKIAEGIYLIPHKTNGLEAIGARSDLYVRRGLRMIADDFSHEHSLVLEEAGGLIILNSCSHAGADNIIREIRETFPGKQILALVGGLHLYKLTDEEVRDFAKRVRETGIQAVYTGHCTGERAFEVLREELGGAVHQFYSGMEIKI